MTTFIDTPNTLAVLEQDYERAITPREKAEALLHLCRFHSAGHHRQMLEYAQEALTQARKARYRKGAAEALKYEGYARFLLGEYAPSVARVTAAQNLYEAINDRSGVLHSLCLLSTIHSYNSSPEEARQALIAAEKWAPAVPDKDTVKLYDVWASFFKTIGDPEKVLEYSGKMLALSERLEDHSGIARACHNLGFVSLGFGDWQTGIKYFDRALAISREMGMTPIELQALQDLAQWYQRINNFDKALEIAHAYQKRATELKADIAVVQAEILLCRVFQGREEYDQALTHAKKMTRTARHYGVPIILTHACITRGELHANHNDVDEAIRWYEQGSQAACKAESIPHIMEVSRRLAELYEKKGDLQTAYLCYRKYMETHEKLLGFTKQKAVASASVALQLEQEERERQRLQVQMESLKKAIEQKQQELTASALLVAEKDERLSELRMELRELLTLPLDQSRQAISTLISRLGRDFDHPQAWEEFNRQFQIADPGFNKAITERFANLTPTELKICSLLRVNLSTKDIAALLSIQPSSVDIYRSAIRKKLRLSRGTNLTAFLTAL